MNDQRAEARDFIVWCADDLGNDIELGRYRTRKDAEKAMQQHIQQHNQQNQFQSYRIVDTNLGYKVVKR
ncbi:unnamed protein product [Adineta ricciae]|uniref:Uncharacterized protein n=1 Tax=Adineta ricciae TaxID=249248 RepID=A0A814I9W2_ADIRI|nr:unnamed protein product [Adineta ricciae]